jgi:hypothetical protein
MPISCLPVTPQVRSEKIHLRFFSTIELVGATDKSYRQKVSFIPFKVYISCKLGTYNTLSELSVSFA